MCTVIDHPLAQSRDLAVGMGYPKEGVLLMVSNGLGKLHRKKGWSSAVSPSVWLLPATREMVVARVMPTRSGSVFVAGLRTCRG